MATAGVGSSSKAESFLVATAAARARAAPRRPPAGRVGAAHSRQSGQPTELP